MASDSLLYPRMTLSYDPPTATSWVLGLQACHCTWFLGAELSKNCQLNSIPRPLQVQTAPAFGYSNGWRIIWAGGVWVGSDRVTKEAGAAARTRCSLLGTSCPYLTLANLAKHQPILHAKYLLPLDPSKHLRLRKQVQRPTALPESKYRDRQHCRPSLSGYWTYNRPESFLIVSDSAMLAM